MTLHDPLVWAVRQDSRIGWVQASGCERRGLVESLRDASVWGGGGSGWFMEMRDPF